MKRIVIGLDGDQNLVDLSPEEMVEIQSRPLVLETRSANKYDLVLGLLDLDLYDQLMDAVNAAGRRRRRRRQWENTTIVSEDDPLVKSLVQGLGWDAATIDRIFGKIDKAIVSLM